MATQKMLKFVTIGRQMPEKRDAADRAQGFPESHPFCGKSEARYRQAGNAVEVNVGRVVIGAALASLSGRSVAA